MIAYDIKNIDKGGNSMNAMNHWERVRATLKGEEVDRPAASLWYHLIDNTETTEKFAATVLNYYDKYDWDFLKVQNLGDYVPTGLSVGTWIDSGEKHFQSAQELAAMKVPDVTAGDFAKMEAAARLIKKGLDGRAPFIWTMTSPGVTIARLMPDPATFQHYLRTYPDEMNHALEVVADTMIAFAEKMVEAGTTGFFFGTNSLGTREVFTNEEYRERLSPYDLKVLKALPKVGSEFTLLHVCRSDCMVREFVDYPADIFNWDNRGVGNPSLAEIRAELNGRSVIGGISRGKKLESMTPAEVKAEVGTLRTALGTKNWFLGAGCAIPWTTPEANIRAVREAVDEV